MAIVKCRNSMTTNSCLLSPKYHMTNTTRYLVAAVVALIAVVGCERSESKVGISSIGTPAPGTMTVQNVRESLPGPKRKYTLAVSIYAGWMPWYYANESGVLK